MKKSIFLQLVLILFLVSAIPSCLTIYKNSRDMEALFQEQIVQSAVDKLKANKDLSDEMITSIVNNVLDLVLARQYSDLSGVLSYEELNSVYDYVKAAIRMQSSLTKIADRNKLVASIFYYMEGADYVISTDNGTVRLEDYEELKWLGNAEELIRGAEGIWYPRVTDPNPVYAGRVPIHVLSFVYRLNSLYTSTKGIIVVNIYESELNGLIFSDSELSTREGILLNSRGDILSHTNKEKLYGNLAGQEYMAAILLSDQISGHGEMQEDGEEILYTWQRSDLYDWTYIDTYSLKAMESESRQMVQRGMVVSLIITLIGVICAVLISFKFAWPIRKLAREVKDVGYAPVPEVENSVNEIQYLANAFDRLREREQTLIQKISEGEQALINEAMIHLMNGERIPEKSRALLNGKFPFHHFIVCALMVDNSTRYQSITTHEQREITRYRIYELAEELCPEEYHIGSVRFSGGSVAIVLNLQNYDSTAVKTVIRLFMKAMQKKCEEAFSLGISIGISGVHSGLNGLKECADEACEAVKHRLISGWGCIYFYHSVEKDQVQTYSAYQHEKRILNYLETGKLESIEEELDILEENIRKTRELSMENVMLVFNQLAGSILVYLNKHNYNAAAVLGAGSNLYSSLVEFETLEEIIKYLKKVYGRIIKYQKDLICDNEDYGKIILRHLEQNFRRDIDFEEMARKIGISYSYLRKIIKEETGKSLIDNLNRFRIEEAKRLLEETDDSVARIAELAGYHNAQSLNRFFQRYEGLSPSEYRVKVTAEKK